MLRSVVRFRVRHGKKFGQVQSQFASQTGSGVCSDSESDMFENWSERCCADVVTIVLAIILV